MNPTWGLLYASFNKHLLVWNRLSHNLFPDSSVTLADDIDALLGRRQPAAVEGESGRLCGGIGGNPSYRCLSDFQNGREFLPSRGILVFLFRSLRYKERCLGIDQRREMRNHVVGVCNHRMNRIESDIIANLRQFTYHWPYGQSVAKNGIEAPCTSLGNQTVEYEWWCILPIIHGFNVKNILARREINY